MTTTPDLSMIVVVFNMSREAPRTLLSLSPGYQRGVVADDYEVIVVDNGSDPPLGAEVVSGVLPNGHYHYVDDASPSPAAAINLGARMARGRYLGLMIDGARLVTPGLIQEAMSALGGRDDIVVDTIQFHLGASRQHEAAPGSYGPSQEDQLLADIEWPSNGYRLFDIATLSGSCRFGWRGPIAESSCVFVPKTAFDRHNGYDERFTPPGGGFLNLDFYRRLFDDESLEPVRIAGEATFHQTHNGAATGLRGGALEAALRQWHDEYKQLRGGRYRPPRRRPRLHGSPGSEAARWHDWKPDLRSRILLAARQLLHR